MAQCIALTTKGIQCRLKQNDPIFQICYVHQNKFEI